MPDSDLEGRRAAVQSQIAQLGDMRSGSITGTGGRCGNPNCHCHQTGDPGHGPYPRLTRKVNGKTVTETFPPRPAWPKLSGGRWRRSRRRPRRKNGPSVRQESRSRRRPTAARDLRRPAQVGLFDLEAIEMAVRSALYRAGAAALTELLRFATPRADQRTIRRGCGHQAHYHQQRSKPVLTASPGYAACWRWSVNRLLSIRGISR
jgi:hypothetical protein